MNALMGCVRYSPKDFMGYPEPPTQNTVLGQMELSVFSTKGEMGVTQNNPVKEEWECGWDDDVVIHIAPHGKLPCYCGFNKDRPRPVNAERCPVCWALHKASGRRLC